MEREDYGRCFSKREGFRRRHGAGRRAVHQEGKTGPQRFQTVRSCK
ncbi:hypothetical protein TRIP_B40092 [uncultured Desulfatiglans sp.]|nr:hypothetical protein TRIP_B40092 [uncultured Desulfatiglans sp.]